MTAAQFNAWISEMISAGLAKSAAECGRMLGVNKNTLTAMCREGTKNLRTDLACRALLHRLEPYS